jgi:cytochrome c-type biogenesis protein CcmH/NrfF
MGVGVMFVGTIIALLPERVWRSPRRRCLGAVTTTLVLILAGAFGLAATQHRPAQVSVVPRRRSNASCRTNHLHVGRAGKKVGECTCLKASQMREEIAKLTSEGKTYDEIIQYYIAQYGSQEPLSAPLDQGFNRLAWLFPYAVGAAGLGLIGAMAVRWSRRPRAAGANDPAAAFDSALERRLDDELRDLD